MAKKSTQVSKLSLIDLVVKGIQEKKGTNIVIIDLRNVMNAYSDYSIVCTGSSDTNVQAISNSIEHLIRESLDEKPLHVEGYRAANWILMDYFETIVHIFKEDEREYYNLESLWADAKITSVTEKEES